ncbi:MAG TPA: UTRA domain-containing protein [Amaricoccus sp.]|nr:UTRA domain-containing protein [Amaricoccus sp.]
MGQDTSRPGASEVPATDLAAGPNTHHERILRDLHRRIVSQAWPPGFRLPYETELAEAYGVSRMTMNKVLARLARDGYLVRKRKLGTFVTEPRSQAAVLEIHDIEAEVRAQRLDYAFSLVDRLLRPATAPERAEARIAAEEAAIVLHLLGVHLAAGVPFCVESRIVNPAAAPRAVEERFEHEGPGKWLLREIPWTSAEHRIRAIGADRRLSRLLAVPAGEPCLEIWRRTEVAGHWVTVSRQTYPGARHQLQASFRPE